MDGDALDTNNGTITNEDGDLLLFMCAFLYHFFTCNIECARQPVAS